MKKLWLVVSALALALTASAHAQQSAGDPLSGTWKGDWGPSASDRNQVAVELKWDGKALTGTVNPGPNAVAIEKATYDAKTKAVRFEASTKNRRGAEIHYVVEGKVDAKTMTGSWSHDDRKGDFKITKE
jgi:hypothetical protein